MSAMAYIQKLVQTKWDVAVHVRDLYLVKPTQGPPTKFEHLTRAEEVVITRLRIGHTKATNPIYLVPRTADWLSPLWSNTEHWPYAPGVCIVTGMSWWTLHSRLIECSLRDNSWDLHSGIGLNIFIFPQLGISFTTIIPLLCERGSSTHAHPNTHQVNSTAINTLK